jgi:hypothetical protein
MASISRISESVTILKVHILFELEAVDYSRIPNHQITKFLTNGLLHESPCIFIIIYVPK